MSLRGWNELPVLSDFAFSGKTGSRNEAPKWNSGHSPEALTDAQLKLCCWKLQITGFLMKSKVLAENGTAESFTGPMMKEVPHQ